MDVDDDKFKSALAGYSLQQAAGRIALPKYMSVAEYFRP